MDVISNISLYNETEPGNVLTTDALIYVILLAVLIPPILILNIIVVVVMLKHRPLQTGNNRLIVSLALADACIAVFVIPGQISGNFSEHNIGNVVCKVCSYAAFVSEAAAAASLTAISLDRVRVILYPLKPKLTMQQVKYIILLIWLIGFVYGLRGGLTFGLTWFNISSSDGSVQSKAMCVMSVQSLFVKQAMIGLDVTFLFVIPAFIVTVSYIVILCSADRHVKRVKSSLSDIETRKKKLKSVRMSIMVISIFVLLHLPKHVILMYASREGQVVSSMINIVHAFLLMAFLNSVLNPIFYGFLNPKVRAGYLKIFKPRNCCDKACCNRNGSASENTRDAIKIYRHSSVTPEVSFEAPPNDKS